MIAAGQPCPMCEAPLALKRLEAFSGDEPPLRVTLRGMPALACGAPHIFFVRPKFALWLLDELVAQGEEKVPGGAARGFALWKRYLCGGCGAQLRGRGGPMHNLHLPLAFEDHGEFIATLSLPFLQCGACGREQARDAGEVRRLVPAALVHAFKEAGVKPPA